MRGLVCASIIVAMSGVAMGQQAASMPAGGLGLRPVRYVIPEAARASVMHGSGKVIQIPCETVWKPACANQPGSMTIQDLAKMSVTHAADLADPAKVRTVNRQGPWANRAGLNLVFQLGANVPAAAVPAFQAAEAYLESQFPNDAMTVTVTVSFAALSPGVIGGTSSSYGYVNWADTRAALVGGMDANDTIQSSLPSGTTIPVRYRANRTTNEDRVFWTFANWKASGGTIAGNDASMQYSTSFPFDFDPSNGVTANTLSLQDVIIHETGHALGFTSGTDFRNSDIEVLDVYRFQRTDGNADYNPDTTAEFGTKPRMGIYNYNDDHNFDIISTEHRLSDGSPYQASHFREQVPAIGIMDPAFTYGETFYSNFLRASDLMVFDAMGYDK